MKETYRRLKMTKRIYGAALAALLGLAFASCGEAGDNALGFVQGKDGTPEEAKGVYALFLTGGESQKVNMLYSKGLVPAIEFAGGLSKEEWLAQHDFDDYNFIDDPKKLGPKYTGGGGGSRQIIWHKTARTGPWAPTRRMRPAGPKPPTRDF
jgi:hypothetical protein